MQEGRNRPVALALWATRFALALAMALAGAASASEPEAELEVPLPPAPEVIDPNLPQRPASLDTPVSTPYFPMEPFCAGIGGTVMLLVDVVADGRAQRVRIEKSSRNRGLDRSAMEAARHWTFRAEIRNGVVVPSVIRVPVEFRSPDPSAAVCYLSAQIAGVELRSASGLFAPMERIDLTVHIDAKEPAELKVVWVRIENGKEQVLREDAVEVRPRPDRHSFQGTWPAGGYRVDLLVNGQVQTSKSFVVGQ